MNERKNERTNERTKKKEKEAGIRVALPLRPYLSGHVGNALELMIRTQLKSARRRHHQPLQIPIVVKTGNAERIALRDVHVFHLRGGGGRSMNR